MTIRVLLMALVDKLIFCGDIEVKGACPFCGRSFTVDTESVEPDGAVHLKEAHD